MNKIFSWDNFGFFILLVIPIAAILDVYFIGNTTFIGYMEICSWEASIYALGVLTGLKISRKIKK